MYRNYDVQITCFTIITQDKKLKRRKPFKNKTVLTLQVTKNYE